MNLVKLKNNYLKMFAIWLKSAGKGEYFAGIAAGPPEFAAAAFSRTGSEFAVGYCPFKIHTKTHLLYASLGKDA